MFSSASWLNRPARCEVDTNKVAVWTDDRTDFWRETHYRERAKAGALCRDMASTIVVRERRIPSLEA